MVDKFNIIRTPRLVFGPGRATEIPDLIKNRGTKILVLTGAKSFSENKAIQALLALLETQKNKLYFERIGREPTPADVDQITVKYHPDKIDVVLAIGGGSVLDAGKAVSFMIETGGNVKDYLEGVGTLTPSGKKKFYLAVPTTAGTGSEATSNAVISETGENGFKKSLRHENFVPDIAVVDPLLALDCPPDITAGSGMDAFTQLVESYLSTRSNTFTDALALDGIRHLKECLEDAVKDGQNVAARNGMAYAAYISGITLSNAGLGLIHGFASAIGGYFYAPHGMVCGTLMGIVNRYNVKALSRQVERTIAHEKYSMLGRILSGKENSRPDWYMAYSIDYIDDLTEKFKIRRLSSFGIRENDLSKIAANSDHKANPVKFIHEDLVEMLKARL